MQTAALGILLASALWLAGIGFLMAGRPAHCLDLFDRMTQRLEASSPRVQLIEQGLRLLAGAASIVRAPASKLPLLLEIVGWLLVLSSVVILVLPIRWHGAYGRWWISRIPPWAIRLLSPLPLMAAAGLVYVVL